MPKTTLSAPIMNEDEAGRSSFSRNFTFTEGFRSESIVSRKMTNTLGLTADSEEEWTKSLIGKYVKIGEKGIDGEVPLPAGFARESR